jgi:DNA-binding NtrC family response regulator
MTVLRYRELKSRRRVLSSILAPFNRAYRSDIMASNRILVVDANDFATRRLHHLFNAMNYRIDPISDLSEYKRRRTAAPHSLVILVSTRKEVGHTIHNVKQVVKYAAMTPVFLISKYGSESLVVSAFRAGIKDYFNASFSDKDLLESIRRHLPPPGHNGDREEDADPVSRMVGNSFIMRKVKEKLAKYAATDCTVMITGDTGTGKDLAARMIYERSRRKHRPFVCLNCAALPESLVESELFGYEKGAFTGAVTSKKGKFEQAAGGTLFLDEIGEMSPLAQAKILRTIENKTVYPLSSRKAVNLDVRLIAATNHDFEQLVAKGRFRKDLYYRLNVAQIRMPPLRERKEDIPDLAAFELGRLNQKFNRKVDDISKDALSSFFLYDWPGNIREMKNILEVAYIDCTGKKIRFTDLPDVMTKKLKFSRSGLTGDRDLLLAALSSTKWNKSKAARKLNWSRMKVYRTLERYDLR